MEWAALVTWILTAGGGVVLLAAWLRHGGMRPGVSRLRPPIVLGHFALASTGLILWLVYVATDSATAAWIAFALLLAVALLGFAMLGRWLASRRGANLGAAAGTGGEHAEVRFPVTVVGLHGALAVTTLALVFLASLGVGS